MNTIREVQRINDQELARGIAGTAASWHDKYKAAAWVYVGNLDTELSEGDVLCVLSQYGELEDVHLVRDEETGQSKGFGFAKYCDARSCILAVDNLIGVPLSGRSLRIDHVENYRLPKHLLEAQDEDAGDSTLPGHAYHGQELANEYSLDRGQDVFAPAPRVKDDNTKEAKRARKEERKRRREEKAQRRRDRERKRMEREERHRTKRAKRYKDDRSESSSGDEQRDKRR